MLHPKIEEAISFVASYASNISSWTIIKRELLNNLPIEYRRLFSKRDPKTKKQNFNDFEGQVVERWKELTGSVVIFRGSDEKR